MPNEIQRELSLFEMPNAAKPSVKRRQMSHYAMAHSVMVDKEQGTITHLHGPDMGNHRPEDQTAVLNETWLDRLVYAVNVLNEMKERQAKERLCIEELIDEILNESRTLDESDIPKRVRDAFDTVRAVNNELENLPVPEWDDNDPPF